VAVNGIQGWCKVLPLHRISMFPQVFDRIRSALYCFVPLFLQAAWVPAAAQVDINQVQTIHRTVAAPRTSANHTVLSRVDLVLVNVTVLDHAYHAVTGLEPANFAVLDDRNPQTIKYCSSTDDPVSVLVVLDASASMAVRINDAVKALSELENTSNPQDDFGLVVIHDKPQLVAHLDSIGSEVEPPGTIQPDGSTALWDGMYLGLRELQHNSRYQRKAMVVISDGGDNHSRHTEDELKSLLKEADVEVYAIGLYDRNASRVEEMRGPFQLEEVTSVTGGRVFSAHTAEELAHAVTQISHELRNQYILGYYPSNRNRDGKWRKLTVHLAGPGPTGKFRLYAKKGYYAPAE